LKRDGGSGGNRGRRGIRDNRISLSAWLPVLLCYSVILATVPVARRLQRFVYTTTGPEFFTWFVIISILAGLAVLMYFFIFRLKVKRRSQYVWILVCAGIVLYNTFRLSKHPEEAIHFLEYGALACFIFTALRRSVPDRTVYFSSLLLVSLAGISDEFFQWMMPQRFWDFRDVWLNTFAGAIFLAGIWGGIRPDMACRGAKKSSVTALAGIMTANILVMGLCLLNTPDTVKRYTAAVDALSWLRKEEPMAEYGFTHRDWDIGAFSSRMSVWALQESDTKKGAHYGKAVQQALTGGSGIDDLTRVYHPSTDAFLHEFLIHVATRDDNLQGMNRAADHDMATNFAFVALRENLVLEQYFGNTLAHSGLFLSDEVKAHLRSITPFPEKEYTSEAGSTLITTFDVGHVWKAVLFMVSLVWIAGGIWKKKLKIIN
jgi:VanZ family protein